MTTIKLTPTQKRQMLATIVTYKVKQKEDITAYVGRNLGDFNYVELYNNMSRQIIFGREINDIFMDAKYGKTETKTTKTKSEGSKKYSKLTELETQVFDYMLEAMDCWIGAESYSPEDVKDISEGTKIPVRKLRGVLSSLNQKQVLYSYDCDISDNWGKEKLIQVWLFTNQEQTTKEELIALVK